MILLRPLLRILGLRATLDDYERLGTPHLVLGLVLTWAVGIGRYWDNPRVGLLQHAGVGSVVYVFVLATFLWLIGVPLKPTRWSLLHVLTFVTLTSPPGFLYAIPVERWQSPESAAMTNVYFLAVVAAWRVAMYVRYLRVYAALPLGARLVQLLLPLTLIVAALTVLNLERAVFEIMGGIRETMSADDAYFVIILLTAGSVYLFPVLLIGYVVLIVQRRRASGSAEAA